MLGNDAEDHGIRVGLLERHHQRADVSVAWDVARLRDRLQVLLFKRCSGPLFPRAIFGVSFLMGPSRYGVLVTHAKRRRSSMTQQIIGEIAARLQHQRPG